MKKEENLGRFISMVLRHKPEIIGITLDEHGWADVDTLIKAMNEHKKYIDKAMLEKIVAENDKKRYSFDKNHYCQFGIRKKDTTRNIISWNSNTIFRKYSKKWDIKNGKAICTFIKRYANCKQGRTKAWKSNCIKSGY